MPWWEVVALVVLVIVVAVAMLGRHKLTAYQVRSWDGLAAQGLQEAPADPALATRWPGLPFDRGTDPEVSGVRTGHYRGHDVLAFDVSVKEPSSKGPTRMPYAVYAVTLPSSLPRLEVQRHLIPGAARALSLLGRGGKRTGDADFDKTFAVDSDDEHFATVVLQEPVRRRMLGDRLASYRICGDTLLSWMAGAVEATTLGYHLDALAEIADLVPADAWRSYGSR